MVSEYLLLWNIRLSLIYLHNYFVIIDGHSSNYDQGTESLGMILSMNLMSVNSTFTLTSEIIGYNIFDQQ